MHEIFNHHLSQLGPRSPLSLIKYFSEGTFLSFINFNIIEQKVSLFCQSLTSLVLSDSQISLSLLFSSLITVTSMFDISTDRAVSCLLLSTYISYNCSNMAHVYY